MTLELLYHEYINIKCNRGLQPVPNDSFEYGLLEDDSAELFFVDREDATFIDWVNELQPRDAHYVNHPDWKPVLSADFEQLDVYDELILYYLLYTINQTMSIVKIDFYNAMNDFMKNYCFFQLSQLADARALSNEQKHQLRDFFFFFYLYAHPVNEETLYGFSFSGQDLVHTKTNILMEHYYSLYHDYYSENIEKHQDQLFIALHEIQASKTLTLELLRAIEGKSPKLTMPPEDGLENIRRLINNVDEFLHMHSEKKTALFDVMRDFLSNKCTNPYREHCFSILLQNYVCYILYFDFDDIHDLVEFFKDTPLWCECIINKMFTDSIFMQKIMRQNHIDIRQYQNVIAHFNEDAHRIYL
ncbi:hypothetical protein [Paenibacillus sp. 1001270B_150601_E10]|uniref:hypothetical protein n=1 Tax=Paenibacillus sp. 1001270B_150601_E10 TaxID=2787079 RepID=UPI00189D11B1|nr:hypothetical protein [Paenibacillus sp. 1001270B_150601_E10]